MKGNFGIKAKQSKNYQTERGTDKNETSNIESNWNIETIATFDKKETACCSYCLKSFWKKTERDN